MKKLPRQRAQHPGKQDRRQLRLSHELSILYEDDAVIALNKPAKLLAVPAENSSAPSALSLLSEELKQKRQRAFVVHRIDRYTSGILLFAKTWPDREALVQQFLKHTPVRQYLAVVRGHLKAKEGTLVHHFRQEGMFQKLTRAARSESHASRTSLFGRTPSARRFARPRFAGDRITESDSCAAFGARTSRHRRPKVSSRGGLRAPYHARCSARRASRVRSSTDGRKHIHRLRTPRRLSIPAASLEAALSPAPVNLAVMRITNSQVPRLFGHHDQFMSFHPLRP